MQTYEFHPICLAFNEMPKADFQALVADVREQGLLVPIILHEGMILDGRHRYQACLEVGTEARFEVYEGPNPIAHALSLNQVRRHATGSQRAMTAATLANLKEGGQPGNQNATLSKQNDSAVLPSRFVTQTAAAKALNVSARYVTAANKILNTGIPALRDAVMNGTISVDEAKKIATLKPKVQDELVAIPKKTARIQRTTKAIDRAAVTQRRETSVHIVAEIGTPFIRRLLGRLGHLRHDLYREFHLATSADIVRRFAEEMDLGERQLRLQYELVQYVLQALGGLADPVSLQVRGADALGQANASSAADSLDAVQSAQELP